MGGLQKRKLLFILARVLDFKTCFSGLGNKLKIGLNKSRIKDKLFIPAWITEFKM